MLSNGYNTNSMKLKSDSLCWGEKVFAKKMK